MLIMKRLHRIPAALIVFAVLLNSAALFAEVPRQDVVKESYRLGPNDTLRIQVLGEDDLTVEGRVTGDGKLAFPLLGVIDVGGLTVQELRENISAKLAEGYLRQPKVTVHIIRYRNFYVGGEVNTPGGYAYEGGLTVQKAISLAGGLTEKAEKRGIKVTRVTEGRAETVAVDGSTMVLPDDTIIVAPAEKFYVTGEVTHPGGYSYEPEMTVQRAVSLAGGFTEKSLPGAITMTRVNEKGVESFTVPMDAHVLADDIIVIDSQRYRFYVSGEVKTPGGYLYKDGLNIQKAIALAGGPTDKADRTTLKLVRMVNGVEEVLPVTLTTVVLPEDTIIVPEGQRFYVSGEVKTPGRFLYEPGVTVQKAITVAGGLTEKADKFGMTVVRVKGGELESIPVQLDAVVRADDVIVVAQAQKFYVNGEVKKPGDYSYEKGLTIHKAITMAGGFTDKAAERRTKVLRVLNGRELSIRVRLEDLVLPDDIIVVPQSFF